MTGTEKIIGVLLFISLHPCSRVVAQVPDASEEPRHKIIFKNEYVRVLEGWVPFQDTTLAHTHSANSIVIFLSASTFGIQNKGQKPVITKVNPGDVVYRAYGDLPVDHIVWNQSATPLHFFVVELLKSPGSNDSLFSRPEWKLVWKNKIVSSFQLTVENDHPTHLPKTNCSYFLINISGTVMTGSSKNKHILNVNDFVFFPPQSDTEIRSGKENAQCLLLELK